MTIANEVNVPRPMTKGASTRRLGSSRFARRDARIGVLLTMPALIALALTTLYPLGWAIVLSFQKFQIGSPPTFVGFANYARVFAKSDFTAAFGHTLLFVVATFVLEAIVALPLALLLNRGLRGSRVIAALVTMPLMVAPVVAALAWRFLFSDGYGFINSFLEWVGVGALPWFSNIWFARTTILISNLWLAAPFDTLMILAGLASLPDDPLEAARIDGASGWQIFRHITLPLLKPVFLIIIVVRLADAFRIFDLVYVLTGSGPANATEVMSTYVYRLMFTNFDFSGGAVVSIVLVATTALAAILAVALLRRGAIDA